MTRIARKPTTADGHKAGSVVSHLFTSQPELSVKPRDMVKYGEFLLDLQGVCNQHKMILVIREGKLLIEGLGLGGKPHMEPNLDTGVSIEQQEDGQVHFKFVNTWEM